MIEWVFEVKRYGSMSQLSQCIQWQCEGWKSIQGVAYWDTLYCTLKEFKVSLNCIVLCWKSKSSGEGSLVLCHFLFENVSLDHELGVEEPRLLEVESEPRVLLLQEGGAKSNLVLLQSSCLAGSGNKLTMKSLTPTIQINTVWLPHYSLSSSPSICHPLSRYSQRFWTSSWWWAVVWAPRCRMTFYWGQTAPLGRWPGPGPLERISCHLLRPSSDIVASLLQVCSFLSRHREDEHWHNSPA